MRKRKGQESVVANYFKSIPPGVKHIRHRPIMRDGVCVATEVSYELNGSQIVKELPNQPIEKAEL